MRGSDYAELRAFVAVADHGSFARAAAQLGLSPSALSQTIKNLEERMGVRLLNRTTRSVAPSQEGERFLANLRPALADLGAAVEDIGQLRGVPSGVLRINATRIAAVQYLAPRIGSFLEAYPDITLDVVAEDRLVDIVAEQFDAGVRLGEMVEKDMIAVKLTGDVEMMVVGSPEYIERCGTPASPRDLRQHSCINFRWPTDLSLYRWEFERGNEKLEAAVTGPLIVNDPDIALPAVLAGAGLAYLFEHQVRALVESGQLIRVLKQWSPPFPGFYLYYPGRRQLSPLLRAFIDFFRHSG